MIGDFTFTLYEVFGYLLPGSIVLAGLILIYHMSFFLTGLLDFNKVQAGVSTWAAAIVVSYILGHVTQAIANLVLKRYEGSIFKDAAGSPLWNRASQLASDLVGVSVDELSGKAAYRIMDEYATQAGQDGDRDMFIYREGFYRGSSIAQMFLSLTLVIKGAAGDLRIGLWGTAFVMSRWQLLSAAIFCGGTAILLLLRYKRFARYRIDRACTAFLVLQQRDLQK